MATIKDIANYTGVSATTVSNVIHGRTAKVSVETRKKVEKALDELNYSSNMAGRLLAKHGSKIIAVIIQDFEGLTEQYYENPYHGELIQSLEYHIRKNGYFMMFHRVANYKEGVKLVQMWDIEGVILSGVREEDIPKWQNSINKPIVFLDSYSEEEKQSFFNVGIDDYQGAFDMVNYIASKDLTDIIYIAKGDSPKKWVGVDAERANGAKDAAKKNNLNIKLLAIPSTYRYYQESIKNIEKIIKEKYVTLFFSSDLLAVQCMSEFYQYNISVPEDVSIVSFDGTPYSKYSSPPITSVYQDINEKSAISVDLLIKRIKNLITEPTSIQVVPELFEGKSLENDFKKRLT